MKLTNHALWILALGTLLMGVPGCMEDIALFPRPTLPEGQPDVVGSVDRVDLAARRLYLHPNGGESRVITYSRDAQIFYRGRLYPMTRLAPGDVVAMQMKQDTRGESYVDLIRVREESAGARDKRKDFASAPRIETLAGKVRSVNRRDNSFELDDRLGQMVSVALSENVRNSDRDRFQTLHSGDHVRIEGKFIGDDRFEMLSFLNDEY
ncbi:MAG: hypothetical protein ACM3SP_05200 [Chloroflexota bacterium]